MVDFRPLKNPAVVVMNPTRHADTRGSLQELFNVNDFARAAGTDVSIKQVNDTYSQLGVLRGIHLQLGRQQGKLVRVLQGSIFDVAVDLRPESPRFGTWVGKQLDATTGEQLWIPPGFGHGFLVIGDQPASVLYFMTAARNAELERAIRWDDPALGIEWPSPASPILSDRDRSAGSLQALETELRDELDQLPR